MHGRDHAGLGDDPVQVLGMEVAHPDRAGTTLLAETDQRAPRIHVPVAQRGPVNEIKVDVVGAELAETVLERTERGVVTVVLETHLRRDEHVGPGYAAPGERRPDTRLVAVHRGGVDAAVPRFEGDVDGGGRLVIGHLVDAQADPRHPVSVVQRNAVALATFVADRRIDGV